MILGYLPGRNSCSGPHVDPKKNPKKIGDDLVTNLDDAMNKKLFIGVSQPGEESLKMLGPRHVSKILLLS